MISQRSMPPTAKPPRSWVIALEVDEDPDGQDFDVQAVARRMDAVAGIHPSPGGGRRHSFLVRLDGPDPADALVAAVSRFREAPVSGANLLGARVVRSGGEDESAAARKGTLRPRMLAAIACALIGGAALFALVPHGGGEGGRANSSPAAATAPVNGNLLSNGSFETASSRMNRKGLARGVTSWGDAHLTLVGAPVRSGQHAQRLDVGPGQLGGLWFELPATAGTTYDQSAWLQVSDLSAGSRAELIVEWYDGASNLIDYHSLPITTTDTQLVRRVQTVKAPPGTERARFLVNFTHGGSLIVDDADMRVVTAPGPAPR